FRQGMENIAADEQRHIGFGVKLLSDLKREDPVGVPKAVARVLRGVTRFTSQVLMPPGWDERYITVFNATFDTVGVEGLTSLTTFQWEFSDPDVPTWHLTVNNGSSVAAEGAAPRPDLRLRLAYQDWVDIVGERLDPRRAIATGRLRPRGNPLALARLTKVFPR